MVTAAVHTWRLTQGDVPAQQVLHHRAQELTGRTAAQSNVKGAVNPLTPVWFKIRSGQPLWLLQVPLPSLCSRLLLHSLWQVCSCLKAKTAPALTASAIPPAVSRSSIPKPLHSSAAHSLISLKVECLSSLLATLSPEKCTPFPIQLIQPVSPFGTFSVDCHWQERED